MEIGERRISGKELNRMIVLKKDFRTKIPKVLVQSGTIFKLESTHVASRLKSFFEILSELDELSDCIFPEEILYINSKEAGYTCKYLNGYKNINTVVKKDKVTLEWKKSVINKIINIIKNLHINGIVHNDLHPSNVLNIASDIKIIDFDQLKIKGLESDYMYIAWLKKEINYLNLLILSVLCETDLSCISVDEQKTLVEELKLSSEFTTYLNNCIEFKEENISDYLKQYVSSITKRDVVNGKNLVKSLKL